MIYVPMAPAVGATVTLTVMFFCVYAGVAVLRPFAQLTGRTDRFMIENALLNDVAGTNFAPML